MASTSQNYRKPSTSYQLPNERDVGSSSPHRSRLQDHHRAKDRWPKRHGKDGPSTMKGSGTTTPDFLPQESQNSNNVRGRQRARSTENLLSPSQTRTRRSPRSGSQPDLLRGSHYEHSLASGRLPPYQPELLVTAMYDSDEEDYNLYSRATSRSRSLMSRQSSIERRHMHCHCNCANKTLTSRREVKRTTGSSRTPINGIQIDDPPTPKQKGKQLVSKAGTSEQNKAKNRIVNEEPSGSRIVTTVETHEPRPMPIQRQDIKSPQREVGRAPISYAQMSPKRAPSMSPQKVTLSPQRQQGTMSPQIQGRMLHQSQDSMSYQRQDTLSIHSQDTLNTQWDDTLYHQQQQRGAVSPPLYETVSPQMQRHDTKMYPRHETMTYPRHADAMSSPRLEAKMHNTTVMPRSVSSQQLANRRREAMRQDGMPQTSEAIDKLELERRRREHSSESSLARLDCVHARQKQLLQQDSSSSSFSDDMVVLERYNEEPRNRCRPPDATALPRHHNECKKCVSERRAQRETCDAGTAVSTEIFLKEDTITGKKQFVKISTV